MDSGTSVSTWMATAEVPEYPALQENTEADVCVIGAGIAGLSTTYELLLEGKSVVVLDDGKIGGGETSRTTAHLSNVIDDDLSVIRSLHGERGLKLAVESHGAAIDRIEQIAREENISCDFLRLDGYLFAAAEDDAGYIDDEFEAAQIAGMKVEKLESAPIDSFQTGPCLRFENQGQFHVLKYLSGLARAITARGGRIFNGTHVEEIESGETVSVKTESGFTVKAKFLVVATNSPVNDWVKMHTKQHPYRTYVVGARVPKGSIADSLFWDSEDPYHYARLQPLDESNEVLIVGGEDHKTGQEDDADVRYERLEAWTRERWPQAKEFEYHWSGQVLETIDGLGFIGQNPGNEPNVFIQTGDSGMGITHGVLGSLILRDLVAGRENEWATLYDPSRKNLRAAGEFIREAANMAAQYKDLVTGGDVGSEEEIAAGEGAILRRGLSKIAAYRDEAGMLHERSAVCPHLGCIVAWNSEEKTWDCPCHGSRFDGCGKVVNGPSKADLAEIEK